MFNYEFINLNIIKFFKKKILLLFIMFKNDLYLTSGN